MNDATDLKQNYSGVFDGQMGFGRSPAIIVVDFISAYTQAGLAALRAGRRRGREGDRAAAQGGAREEECRSSIRASLYHPSGADGGLFVQKVPTLRKMVEGEPLADIVPELPPGPDDVILIKQYAARSSARASPRC